MSPHFSSLRDGNRKAVPEQYLPGDYGAPFSGWPRTAAAPPPAIDGEEDGPLHLCYTSISGLLLFYAACRG